MANKIIEARVWQKVDTEANWLANPLPLGSGEQAFVSDKNNFKVNTFPTKKTFAELEYFYKGDVIGNVVPGEDLSLKSDGVYYAQTSGEYGGVVVKEGYYTLLRKTGNVWSLESEVKMPMQDLDNVVKDEDLSYKLGNQIFDKVNVIREYYVNNSGNIVTVSSNKDQYSYGFIDLTNKGNYTSLTISNFLSSTGIAKYYAFKDSNDVTLTYNRLDPANTKTLPIPNNAIKLVFTIDVLNSPVDVSTIMVNYGNETLPYEEYSSQIDKIKDVDLLYPIYSKKELISNNLIKNNIKKMAYIVVSSGYLATTSTDWNVAWKMPTKGQPKIYIKGLNTSASNNISFFTGNVPTKDAFSTGEYDSVFLQKNTFTKTNGTAVIDIPATATWFAINVKNATESTDVYKDLFISLSPISDDEIKKDKEFVYAIDGKILASSSLVRDNGDVILSDDVATKSDVKSKGVNVSFLGENSILKYKTNDKSITQSIAYNRPLSSDKSNVLDFRNIEVNGEVFLSETDGSAPYNMLGTTIGGNHGFSKTILTVGSHNKTLVDVGSIWETNSKEIVLIRIVSSTQLEFSSRNDNTAIEIGSINHISGATNTSSMTSTASSSGQLYPSIKDRRISVSIDGIIVSDFSKEYQYVNNIVFSETYDLMDKVDMMNWLISKVGTITTNTFEYKAQTAVRVCNNYVIDTTGKCTIYTDLLALKNGVSFDKMMFVMSNAPIVNFNYYIPTALPFTYNGQNLDFANKVASTSITFSSNRIDFGSTNIQSSGLYGDRVIFERNGYGLAMGFLPIQDATIEKRRVLAPRLPLQISTTKKVYMHGVNSSDITQLNKGDYYSVVVYKDFFVVQNDETSSYMNETNDAYILYLDYHKQGVFKYSLNQKLFGKTYEIVEKTSNIEILNKENNGVLTIETSSSNKCYLILKFTK